MSRIFSYNNSMPFRFSMFSKWVKATSQARDTFTSDYSLLAIKIRNISFARYFYQNQIRGWIEISKWAVFLKEDIVKSTDEQTIQYIYRTLIDISKSKKIEKSELQINTFLQY